MKVLLVSYYFSPAVSIGVKRPLSLFLQLKKCGHFVRTITANWEGEKLDGVTYLGSIRTENISTNNKTRKKWFKLSAYIRSFDKTLCTSFLLSAILHFLKHRKQKPDVIVASYKPMASVAAGIFASAMYRRPLIIEMRDLISIFGRKKRVFILDFIDRTFDRLCMKFATEIVVVSPTAKQYAEKLYKRRVHLLYNGIEEAELCEYIKSDSKTQQDITIFYSGNLSTARRLENVCDYINEHRGPSQIVLRVASAQNPENFGAKSGEVDWLGFISREEVYEHQRKSDYLLILEGHGQDSIENIPAKLYEYLGTNKPILADCNPNSDIVSVLLATQHGCCISTQEIFDSALNTGLQFSLENVLEYTRQFQNEKYIKLLDKVASQNDESI